MITLLLAAQLPVVLASYWRVTDRRDPITDKSEIYAFVGTQQRYIAIGCDHDVDNLPTLVVQPGVYLGAETRGILAGGRPVTVRFDNRPPLRWRAEYQEEAVTEDHAEPVRQFIESAGGTTRLVVRLLKHDREEIDLVFDYDNDPGPVIRDALSRCGMGERG